MTDDLATVGIPDEELSARIKILVASERRSLAVLLAHIAEFDRRGLYEKAGFRTLWEYCTRELGYSESSALKRIVAARLLRRYPAVLPLIAEGKLHLSALVLLSPHLTPDNHRDLLRRAEGKSKRELQFLAAGIAPRPDAPDMVRRLPAPSAAAPPPAYEATPSPAPEAVPEQAVGPAHSLSATGGIFSTGPRPLIEPLTAQRALIRFTGGREFLALLDRAREVLRHTLPNGALEEVFTSALQALLDKRDPVRILRRRQKRGERRRRMHVRAGTRRIPTPVRDAVLARDGGRCAFVGAQGRRCEARGGLEFDHILPWTQGGRSDDAGNLRLLCREHNQSEARRVLGEKLMDRFHIRRRM